MIAEREDIEKAALYKIILQVKLAQAKNNLTENGPVGFYHFVSKELVEYYGSRKKLAEILKQRGFKGEVESIRNRISKYENGKIMPSLVNAEILEYLYFERIKTEPIYHLIQGILKGETHV